MAKLLRHLPYVFLFGLALLDPCIIRAQQLSHEPAGGMEESLIEEDAESPAPSASPLPAKLDTYPLNTYYTTWDTLSVRRYADVMAPINDSVILPLTLESTGNFFFPRDGKLLSPFGYRGRRVHAGVDLKLNLYDSVGAAFDGVVRLAKYYRGYGNCVVIRHYNGLETLYGHLSRILVRVNQPVQAGTIIGLGGHTGRATCNHLHFETRFKGLAFNPKQLIDFDSFRLLNDTLVITKRTFGRSRDYLPGTSSLTASVESKTGYSSSMKSSGARRYHTIRSGDTLGAISRKYGTSVKQICAINGIKSTKLLKLGSKLRVR